MPIIITENYEQYQYYISLLFIHFGNTVRELLNNHQNGLFQLFESRLDNPFIESDILYDFGTIYVQNIIIEDQQHVKMK